MICIPPSFINIHFSYINPVILLDTGVPELKNIIILIPAGQITMEIASKDTIRKDKKRNSAQKVKCASVVPGILISGGIIVIKLRTKC